MLLLAVIFIALSFLRLDYIGGSGDADLLWNQKEAYLLVHGEHWGYVFSYLGYAVQVVKNYFGVIAPPDEQHPFTTVVRITPLRIERYQEKQIFDFFIHLDDGLYAWGPEGSLWRWAGTHFERASADERQKLSPPSLPKKDVTDLKGWSTMYSIESKISDPMPIQIGSMSATVTVKGGQASINLSHLVRSPERQTVTERIYYGSGAPQRVSKAEYERVFGIR